MEALSALTGDTYRQDYIAGNLNNHILEEYEKARVRLGDTDTDSWWEQLERNSSVLFEVLSSIAGDLPMVYCAANAIINPSKFSIASIAVLQQSSTTLRWSMQSIIRETRSFQRHVSKLKNLYALSEKLRRIPEGDAPYPSLTSHMDGMSLELKDVVFRYPGSKNKAPALDKVSLNLKPGQLVVIVGANGSGKSTIIKLLTRLYNPISGSLFIDGTLAQEYRPSDLHHTMATFTQDHHLYPLPLYENISLGNFSRSTDTTAVAEAARQGGAAEFIAKLADGLDTILNPQSKATHINVPDDPAHPLRKRIKMLSKKIDISGGEKQRLVAYVDGDHSFHAGVVLMVC
ncbi:hypothetical protein H0H87_001042 [Tephrocybe sp. NHM501043]|nr:hypothetical protein H0H87_001042 [Tephrocybe sp. NHM501043]